MKNFLVLLFAVTGLSAPAYAQTFNDGPIEITMRVRDIKVTASGTDAGVFGSSFGTEEYTFYLWGRDNADVDGTDWQGGTLLTHDFPSLPGQTADFNRVIFTHTYNASTAPQFLDIKLNAWEDESGDQVSGNGCASNRDAYETGFCCGGVFSGSCLGSIEDDDNHCDGDPFITGLNYRLGAPGQWYDHGYVTGTCANNFYQPHIETTWRYVNGGSIASPIDLGTLSAGSHISQVNSTGVQGATGGSDVYYKIVTTAPAIFKTSVCATGFTPFISVLNASGSTLFFENNTCTSAIKDCRLLAGTYYIKIEGGLSPSAGVFTLDVRLGLATAGFSGTSISGCAPITPGFTDLSSTSLSGGTISDWSWDFGDGQTSTAQNPSHTYSTPGDFMVRLRITVDGCGDTETKNTYVHANGPSVDFAFDATSGCAPLPVNFTDNTVPDATITSWVWDFGDAVTSASQNPAHTYIVNNSFSVSLTVNDADGCSKTVTKSNLITTSDVAPPAITCPGNQQVSFGASCQFTLPDYRGLANASDNCGTPVVSQSPSAGTVITTNQTVTLTVTDGATNSTQCTFEVISTDQTPPSITCPGNQQVSFNASCQFTLPDYRSLATASDNCGAPVVSQSPAAGTIFTASQTVTLTATDGAANTTQCTFQVIPKDDSPPVITCPGKVESCDAVVVFAPPVFLDNCSGATLSLLSGLPSGSTFPPGVTTNTYEVTDGNGNKATCSFNITRHETVTISAGADQAINAGFSYTFTPVSNNASSFEWTPSDGLDNEFSANPVATPQATTLYTVTASDTHGCSATDEVLITVNGTIEINNFMSPNGDGKNDTWEIRGNWLINACHVQVFNAWGNEVFGSTGYNNTWDGTSRGSNLPDGVYYYVISCDGETPLTGAITLKRNGQ